MIDLSALEAEGHAPLAQMLAEASQLPVAAWDGVARRLDRMGQTMIRRQGWCHRGHRFDDVNTYWVPSSGKRECHRCRNDRRLSTACA